MTVRVHLAASLHDLTGGVAAVELHVATVRELLTELDRQFPGVAARLSEGTSVAINGDIIPDAIYEPLPDGAEVHFLPSISGG